MYNFWFTVFDIDATDWLTRTDNVDGDVRNGAVAVMLNEN